MGIFCKFQSFSQCQIIQKKTIKFTADPIRINWLNESLIFYLTGELIIKKHF